LLLAGREGGKLLEVTNYKWKEYPFYSPAKLNKEKVDRGRKALTWFVLEGKGRPN